MKSAQGVVRTVATLAWIVCVLGIVQPMTAQGLSDREIKKIERQAGKAEEAGRGAEVRELYERLLKGTDPGDARRANALFLILSQELMATDEMTSQSEGVLDELLAKFPRHRHRSQIEFVDRWRRQQSQLKEQAAQMADLSQTLLEQQAACEAMKGELSGAAGEKEEQLSRDARRLRRQLAAAREELSKTKAELEKKEEALEKLKDALVSGGS